MAAPAKAAAPAAEPKWAKGVSPGARGQNWAMSFQVGVMLGQGCEWQTCGAAAAALCANLVSSPTHHRHTHTPHPPTSLTPRSAASGTR
jgi:hypothetical protein